MTVIKIKDDALSDKLFKPIDPLAGKADVEQVTQLTARLEQLEALVLQQTQQYTQCQAAIDAQAAEILNLTSRLSVLAAKVESRKTAMLAKVLRNEKGQIVEMAISDDSRTVLGGR